MTVKREVTTGYRKILYKPFCWYDVVLNLPGDLGCQTNRPWFYNRVEDVSVSDDIYIYIEKYIPTGKLEEDCWKAYRRWLSVCTHLIIQEA